MGNQGSHVDFLKEFVTNPQEIGAVVPSSDELAAALADSIDWGRVRVVAEFGPGLGALTKAILERLDGRDFFAVEQSEAYARTLRETFPGLKVYRDSVSNIEAILESHGVDTLDAIVSSLPWTNFSTELQDEILDATLKALAPEGQLATFSYIHSSVLPRGSRFREKIERRFETVTRRVVWRNFPPATVFHCER